MALLAFEGLRKTYGRTVALDGLDLAIDAGSFTVLCGPPRSGKSVLMRILVGLERPDAGRLGIDGIDITNVPPGRRRLSYVPQSFALYPHMTVHDNIAYPMRLQGAAVRDVQHQVDRAAQILNITHLLQKRPDQLSGGEKQRTAVARGLVKDADVFILDDPLVGLDFKLRERLMDDLRTMQKELQATFFYATADSLEALTMADSLAVIEAGRILQHGETEAVYDRPAHQKAMQIVGFPRCNFLDGRMTEAGGCETPAFTFPVEADGDADASANGVQVGIRPEAITVTETAMPGHVSGVGRVRLVEDLGAETVVYFEVGSDMLVTCHPADTPLPLGYDDAIPFAVDPASLVVFDGQTGRRLGRGAGNGHA